MSSVAGGVVGTTAVLSGAGGGAPLHVLAVDDSSVDRAVISGILRSSRFRGESNRGSGCIAIESVRVCMLQFVSLRLMFCRHEK